MIASAEVLTHADRKRIDEYLDILKIDNYSIRPDGIIDVNGSVIYSQREDVIPDWIQFGHVSGSFSCSWADFENLKGCPLSLGEEFRCFSLKLQPSVENFEVLYRYAYEKICIYNDMRETYGIYYKNRKRIETIQNILT